MSQKYQIGCPVLICEMVLSHSNWPDKAKPLVIYPNGATNNPITYHDNPRSYCYHTTPPEFINKVGIITAITHHNNIHLYKVEISNPKKHHWCDEIQLMHMFVGATEQDVKDATDMLSI